MRPVADQFKDTQQFGEGATAGVAPSWTPNTIGWYVRLYGDYQHEGHAGKDIGCPIGTPIHAVADGTVLYAGWCEDLPGTGNVRKWLLYYNFGGIVTVIQHDGWIGVVAHQSNNDHVKAGDRVKEGQLVGLSGNTKTRTTTVAPHVHAEALVYLDYRTDVSRGIIYGRVDPTPFFGGIAAQGTITPASTTQEDEVISDADIQRIADKLIPVIITLNDQYHGVTRSNVIEEISKKIEDGDYQVKVFTQNVVNPRADQIDQKLEELK